MSLERDAVFLAGFIMGTYDLRGEAKAPLYVQNIVDRVMVKTDGYDLEEETLEIAEEEVEQPEYDMPQEATEEEKIAAHIEKNGVTKPKRKNNRSPERREAAAQRMRDMQAQKKAATITVDGVPLEEMRKEDFRASGEPFKPEQPRIDTPPEELIERHNEMAGKRDDGMLADEDWPEIKILCQRGRTPRQIASDYGIDPAYMKKFIDDNLTSDARKTDARRNAS